MPTFAPPRRRAPARLAAALLPAALLAACGGDKVTGPGGVAGTYALQTVNGQPLPAMLVQSDQARADLTAGSLELRADNHYAAALTIRATVGGQTSSQSTQDTGTYTVGGSTVTFRSGDGSSATATVNGGRLTGSVPVDGGGTLTFVFQK